MNFILCIFISMFVCFLIYKIISCLFFTNKKRKVKFSKYSEVTYFYKEEPPEKKNEKMKIKT